MQDPQFIQWLLDAQTPSIRFLTLAQLIGRPDFDPELRAAQKAKDMNDPIREIVSKQTKIGAWAGERGYYTPKYTSTHWSLLLLAELAADGQSSHMRRGALYMLGETWDELQVRLDEKAHGLTCFWANLARYALHCDLDDDPRLRCILEALLYDASVGEWRCKHNDERPCAWGAARALWAFARLPEHLHTDKVRAAVRSGLSFLLEEHDLVAANYPTPGGGSVHSLWFRMNFPLFYQVDILFVLRTLAELGSLDHPRAGAALEWLLERRTRSGHWRGSNPFRQRTWGGLGDRDDINRWVSLHAALVLKASENPGNPMHF